MTFHENSDSVYSIAYSPDGQHNVLGSLDNSIRVWDTNLGICVATLKGHSSYVMSVAYSTNGQCIASGSHDKTIKIWEFKKNSMDYRIIENV